MSGPLSWLADEAQELVLDEGRATGRLSRTSSCVARNARSSATFRRYTERSRRWRRGRAQAIGELVALARQRPRAAV